MSCLLIAVQQKKNTTFPVSHSACANPPSHDRHPRGSCDCCLSNTELRNGNARGFKVRARKKNTRGGHWKARERERERAMQRRSCFAADFRAHTNENLRKVFVLLLRNFE